MQSLWPKDARIVVVLTFLMENWSEGKAPPYSPMTSPPKPGTPDRAGIQWSNYAGRSGIARLIRIARARRFGRLLPRNRMRNSVSRHASPHERLPVRRDSGCSTNADRRDL